MIKCFFSLIVLFATNASANESLTGSWGVTGFYCEGDDIVDSSETNGSTIHFTFYDNHLELSLILPIYRSFREIEYCPANLNLNLIEYSDSFSTYINNNVLSSINLEGCWYSQMSLKIMGIFKRTEMSVRSERVSVNQAIISFDSITSNSNNYSDDQSILGCRPGQKGYFILERVQ